MEIEQFASLGERISFDNNDQGKSKASKGKRSSLNIARRSIFVLFKEIIEDSPSQTRSVIFDPKQIPEDAELLESIKQNGIISPIIVRGLGQKLEIGSSDQKKSSERSFALVAGHRRVAAGRAAGLAGTDAVIAKSSEDYQLLTLVENMGRRGLTTYEKAHSLNNLKLSLKISGRKVAEITGYSRSYVNRLLTSLDSPEILQNLWEHGNLSEKVIVILKKHWQLFAESTNAHHVKKIHNLTEKDSLILRDLLNAGLDLEKAIHAMKAGKTLSSISKKSTKTKLKGYTGINLGDIPCDDIAPSKDNGKDLVKNILTVFPTFPKEKAQTLFISAIAVNVLDPDIIWAAALYVVRGGMQDKAIEICAKVMSNQEYRDLLSGEVKSRQQISQILKTKPINSNLKKFFKTYFIES